jgi:hypothetical protein
MINIDALNDEEKLAALESIHKSIAESKEIQRKKITTNVEMIVKALKKIEADLKQRYDETGQLIANLKSGEDGRDGKDGKDGKNGKDGRDGPMGPRGYDGVPGRNGLDGTDGVSVTDAHIDFDGSLIISLSSGRVINVGEVVAADIAEKIKVITNGGGTSQSVLDAIASLQAQIDAIASGLEYQGTWNASTNVPTLASSVGTAGYYYIVATAGSTNLNGITDWQIGDWAVFNGTVWQKIDQTNLVTSVAGRTGAIVLTTADIGGLGTIATQAANNVSITGGSISGITDLAIADGGTGASTAAAAITALTGTQTAGYYLRSNGTGAFLSGIQAADVPTLNQNTTGSAATLSLTNPVSRGGTNLTSLTNKGVLYASSTSQVATGTALQFDGNNLGVSTTPSAWSSAHRAIEIGDQTSVSFFSSGATKVSTFATNIYNVSTIGARDYYKANGVAAKYTQYTGEHVWSTAPSGIAGPTTGITTGRVYTNLTAGNQPDFGASDGFVGTIWTATSSGTLSSGTVVQNVDFVESMRIDTSSNVGIGTSLPGSRLDVKGTLRLSGSTSGYVGFAPAAAAGSTTYTLPTADGTTGQSLVTNGSGVLSWASGSGGTVTSVGGTGTVSGLTLTGTVTSSGNLTLGGALDLSAYNGAGAFTTLSASSTVTLSGGTANGVAYLNGSKVVTSGSALTFDGTDFSATGTTTVNSANSTQVALVVKGETGNGIRQRFIGQASSGQYNWQIGTSITAASNFEIIPSTAVDGTTFSTAAYSITGTGTSIWAVGGSEQMRLTSTGLGIGTSSPSARLHVSGTTNLDFIVDSTNAAGTRMEFRRSGTAYTYFGDAGSILGSGFTGGTALLTVGANPLYLGTNSTTKATLDSSGNLGLGVTPGTWSDGKVIEINTAGNGLWGEGNFTILFQNARYNSGYKYARTGVASSHYDLEGGAHKWYNAPSGTAGDAISFSQAMTLDASGVLLVGKTSNSAYAAGGALFGVNGAADNGVSIAQSQSTGPFLTFFNSANSGFAGISQTAAGTLTTSATTALAFNTSSTQRMIIDSSGNLGLGVTPSAWSGVKALQVGSGASLVDFGSSNILVGSNLYFDGTNNRYINTDSASYYQQNNSVHSWHTAASGTAGDAITFTQAMTLAASGGLSIGTTTDAGAGNILVGNGQVIASAGSGNAYSARLSCAYNFPTIDTYLDSVAGTSYSGQIMFRTSSGGGAMTERARIDSSGNLLIGDTTAAAKLWVYRTDVGNLLGGRATNASYASTVGFLGADRNTTNNSFYYLDCYNYGSTTYRLRIADSGNVTNTNNSYGAISDVKLKENIVDATPKLAGLMQVKVRNYNLIGETTKQLGVVAQELETVFPAMVDETSDKDAEGNDLGTTTKSVKYSVFVPMLIKAIQEQQAIIESLKARLDAANL